MAEAYRRARVRAVRELAQSDDGIQELARVLQTEPDTFVRADAIAELSKDWSKSAIDVLSSALSDDAVSVRLNATRALGRIKSEATNQILGDILLESPDQRMRWLAARVLVEQHSDTAR